MLMRYFIFFKQKTAYEMRISDRSSDVCSSDLVPDLKRRVNDGSIVRHIVHQPGMIVVQHVDAAEAGDSLLYHLFHRLLVAAVKIDGMRIFTDLSNDVLRAFQENVSDDDLCSFAREPRSEEHTSELQSQMRTSY